MKIHCIVLILAVAPMMGCKGPPPMTPQQAATVAELDTARARQLELAAEARAAGDDATARQHEAAAEQMESEAARLESQGITDSAGALLRSIGEALPWPVNGAPELLLPFVPLLFRRPRKHFAKAVRSLNPLGTGMAPGEAVASILRAYGLKHSSPDTEAVADGKAKAVPENAPPS